jgi:hypothetical protein
VDHPEFHYKTLLKADLTGQVTSVLAYHMPLDRGLQAVMWSGRRKAWIYAPGIVTAYLFDLEYQDRTQTIDRTRAEQLARDILHAELPSEETLQAMCEEGERMDWVLGPPRE